jgi:hypothetical protein
MSILLKSRIIHPVEELVPMSANERTSAQVAAIASRAMENAKSLTADEIQALAASVLSQNRQSGQQNQQGQANRQSSSSQQGSGQQGQNPQSQQRK